MRRALHPYLVNEPFGDPGLFVDFLFERRALLFDLGDIRALPPRKLLRVSDIFVTHCHMDHFIGLDWFLRICLGRERAVRLYGPPGFIDRVEAKLAGYTWNLLHRYGNDFGLEVTEVLANDRARRARFHVRQDFRREPAGDMQIEAGVLLDEPGLRVRCALLDHGTPCLGFALEERQHVNIWKTRLAELGLPVGPWLQGLKHAVLAGRGDDYAIAGPAGQPIALGTLRDCVRITPGMKLAYITDAVYSQANAERIVDLAHGADSLFIESVFLDEAAERAADKRHLTAGQAGRLARAAEVKAVEPFHFSPIYREREAELRAELERALMGA
ncbi:MAG: MBL fold metallo-hydrolase [Betaproteobacteria bacterium]|nr:MBL fold metallo-hydrolase [Betaproteobacteria bacterium]